MLYILNDFDNLKFEMLHPILETLKTGENGDHVSNYQNHSR